MVGLLQSISFNSHRYICPASPQLYFPLPAFRVVIVRANVKIGLTGARNSLAESPRAPSNVTSQLPKKSNPSSNSNPMNDEPSNKPPEPLSSNNTKVYRAETGTNNTTFGNKPTESKIAGTSSPLRQQAPAASDRIVDSFDTTENSTPMATGPNMDATKVLVELFGRIVQEVTDVSTLKAQENVLKKRLAKRESEYARTKKQHEKFPSSEEAQSRLCNEAQQEYDKVASKLKQQTHSFNALATQAANDIIPTILQQGNSSKGFEQFTKDFTNINSKLERELADTRKELDVYKSEMNNKFISQREAQKQDNLSIQERLQSIDSEQHGQSSELQGLRKLFDEHSQSSGAVFKSSLEDIQSLKGAVDALSSKIATASEGEIKFDDFNSLRVKVDNVGQVLSKLMDETHAVQTKVYSEATKQAERARAEASHILDTENLQNKVDLLENDIEDIKPMINKLMSQDPQNMDACSRADLATAHAATEARFQAIEERIERVKKDAEDLVREPINALGDQFGDLLENQEKGYETRYSAFESRLQDFQNAKFAQDVKSAELGQAVEGHDIQIENLLFRVDNINTTDLAKSILSQVSEVYPYFHNVEEIVKDVHDQLGGQQNRLAAVENAQAAVSPAIRIELDTLTSLMQENKGGVSDIRSSIATLRSDVTGLQWHVAKAEEIVNSVAADVVELSTKMEANKQIITTKLATACEAASNLQKIQNRLNELESHTPISTPQPNPTPIIPTRGGRISPSLPGLTGRQSSTSRQFSANRQSSQADDASKKRKEVTNGIPATERFNGHPQRKKTRIEPGFGMEQFDINYRSPSDQE